MNYSVGEEQSLNTKLLILGSDFVLHLLFLSQFIGDSTFQVSEPFYSTEPDMCSFYLTFFDITSHVSILSHGPKLKLKRYC